VRVANYRDEFGLQALDDSIVGEQEPPVPKSVVSRAAERMSVHHPPEHGFSRFLRFPSRPHDVRAPRNAQPFLLVLGRLKRCDSSVEGWRKDCDGNQKAIHALSYDSCRFAGNLRFERELKFWIIDDPIHPARQIGTQWIPQFLLGP
jgi:hypothetical protein